MTNTEKTKNSQESGKNEILAIYNYDIGHPYGLI